MRALPRRCTIRPAAGQPLGPTPARPRRHACRQARRNDQRTDETSRSYDCRHGDEIPTSRDWARSGARQRDERGGNGAFRAVRGNRQRICCLTFRSWQSGASRNQEDCVDAADIAGVDAAMSLTRHRQNPVSAMPMSWGLRRASLRHRVQRAGRPRIPRAGCLKRPGQVRQLSARFLESRRARARSAPARCARHALA